MIKVIVQHKEDGQISSTIRNDAFPIPRKGESVFLNIPSKEQVSQKYVVEEIIHIFDSRREYDVSIVIMINDISL